MRSVLLFFAVFLLQGCHALHVTSGHLSLLSQRVPLERAIEDAGMPESVRSQLALAREVLAFAHEALGLPDNGSYRHFVALEREAVLWNVVVAPEFSVEPLTWCAPVAGCVAYRGWFDRAAAERFADRHRARGHDAAVGGVQAYSTLGWFRDPIVSTMLGDPLEIAALLFHELAHQRFYAPGDSALSEAFAMVVEMEGMRRWFSVRGDEAGLQAYSERLAARRARAAAMDATRMQLRELYASALPEVDMRERKQAIFEALRIELGERHPRNNAYLAAVATYWGEVPRLEVKLASVEGDLERFYALVEASR